MWSKNQYMKDLMVHIKDAHGSQPCTKFGKGQCDRQSRCWYSHSKLPNINANLPEPTARQVFFSESHPNLTPSVTGKMQPGVGGRQQPTEASAPSAHRKQEPETRTGDTCNPIPDDANSSSENNRNTEPIKKVLSRNQKQK